MSAAYADLVSFVQALAPTWRKTQHEGFAQLLAALLERPTLCETALARAWPRPEQPLHGRLPGCGGRRFGGRRDVDQGQDGFRSIHRDAIR